MTVISFYGLLNLLSIFQEDEGSPLVVNNKQVAIANFYFWRKAISCASGIPDVYTRVSHYKNWIFETIAEYEQSIVIN